MRIIFAEYNVRDIRISHPYRLSNNIKGNQRYITFIHASLLLGNKYEFYVYLTSPIRYSSGLLLCEREFTQTSREAFNILHTLILLMEYNLRDIRISHPVSFIKSWVSSTDTQRWITFLHASLLLGY